MKSLIMVALLTLFSQISFAGPFVSEGFGPMEVYENCNGSLEDGTQVSFEIRSTAAPTFIDSTLIDVETDEILAQLSCKRTGEPQGNTPVKVWECFEYMPPYNGVMVNIYYGGFAGKSGEVTLNQAYPLSPKTIGSLFCR